MATACSLALQQARSTADHYRQQASLAHRATSVERLIAGGYPSFQELTRGQDLAKAAEQYEHFHGHLYSVIHRIAVRMAAQSVKMGRKATEPSLTSWAWDKPPGRKMTVFEKARAPEFVKAVDEDVEIIETHPLLSAIQTPNSYMTDWALVYTTVCSIMLTGRCFWWFVQGEEGALTIHPLPSHWVHPIHSEDKINAQWRIRPAGNVGNGEIVDGSEVACFSFPDPSNPIGSVSPTQSQAPTIATDEEIQSAQWRFFKNGIFPGIILTLGRLPSYTGIGEGPRMEATPEQRREITEAARALWGGTVNRNEPFIVDRLIEDVRRISNTSEEMGFIDSAQFIKSRIFQAFGMNPYILGEVTGSNKAQAIVAEESFATNCITPIATMISRTMTKHIGDPSIYFWLELPQITDPDLRLRAAVAFAPYAIFTKGWVRKTFFEIPSAEDGTDEEYVQSGGGGIGGFGFPSFGSPQVSGQKPQAAQGTPASQIAAGNDQARLNMEPANLPTPTAPSGDQDAATRDR